MDANNVRSALTGAVYRAPLGSTLPTNPTSPWAVAFEELGYVSEDGLTETRSDDWNAIRAWQNRTIVRQLLTGSDYTLAFSLLETTAVGLETYHSGSLMTDNGSVATMEVMEPTEQHYVFGLDVLDGDVHMRLIIPDGQVTEVGEIVYKNGEPLMYPLTITARSDPDGLVAIKMSDAEGWQSA